MPAPGQLSLGLTDDPIAIRELLVEKLRAGGHRGRLVPEMGLCQGEARVDLAAIDTRLDGYEVKSARDDLRRLAAQAAVYGQVFDRVTLVAPSAHLSAAALQLPEWWGFALVDGGTTTIEIVRSAAPNPQLDLLATVRLLWRDEAARLLESHLGRRSSAPRPVLWRRLVDIVPPAELRAAVCRCLMARTGWPTAG